MLDAVEDEVGGLLRRRGGVVAERRARVAELHEVLARAREALPAREPRRARHDLSELRRRRARRQEDDRLARARRAARIDDAQPGLQVIEALLRGQRAEETDEAVQGREAHGELLAAYDAARVGGEPRQVEPHLPERDPQEHASSILRTAAGSLGAC